jgi:hypothetical protein
MARVIQVDPDAFQSTEAIPVGTKLKVSVYEIDEGVSGPNSKKPGSKQFVYTAKVTEEGPYKGREIRYNYVSMEGGWMLASFADAVGWPVDPKASTVTIPDHLNEVLGSEFVAKIGQQTDNNNIVRNRVTGIQKIKAGGGTQKKEASWDAL